MTTILAKHYSLPQKLFCGLKPTSQLTIASQPIKFKSVPECPVCDSRVVQNYGQVKVTVARRDVVLNYDECKECGSAFQNPVLPGKGRRLIYDESYMQNYGSDHVNLQSPNEHIWRMVMTDNRFQSLLELAPKRPQMYLDIGFGRGLTLEIAQLYGLKAFGIDVSYAAWQEAREKGLNASHGELSGVIEKGIIRPGSMDLITLFDVVEHYDDLMRELGLIRSILRPGGMLYLHTPDFSTSDQENKHRYFSLDHRFIFSQKSLRSVVEAAGFDVAECAPSQNIGNPDHAIHPAIKEDPRFEAAADYVEKKSSMLYEGHWHIGLVAFN